MALGQNAHTGGAESKIQTPFAAILRLSFTSLWNARPAGPGAPPGTAGGQPDHSTWRAGGQPDQTTWRAGGQPDHTTWRAGGFPFFDTWPVDFMVTTTLQYPCTVVQGLSTSTG